MRILVGFVLLSAALPVRAAAQTGSIPILAHFVNWHQKNPEADTRGFTTTMPVRWGGQAPPGYDSLDEGVLSEQNREMLEHGIVPLMSWWGPANPAGDPFLDRYLTLPGPQLALLYEVTGRLLQDDDGLYDMDDPIVRDRFIDDVRHLHERYWSKPEFADRWFRIDGKPVLFIWLSHAFKGSFEAIGATLRSEFPVFVVGSNFNLDLYFAPGLQDIVRGMDAVSSYGSYNPSLVHETGGRMSLTYVTRYIQAYRAWMDWLRREAPGVRLIPPVQFAFEDQRGNPRLTSSYAEASTFAEMVRLLMEYSWRCEEPLLPMINVVSYNEHFEGSAIEPTIEYGADWIEILAAYFRKPLPGRGQACVGRVLRR